MRLPYAPSVPDPQSADPAVESAYEQLTTRRQPSPIQALDLTLLHSPPIASGWSSFLGAIRTRGILPPEILELCICRVAILNGAAYEWEHHIPLLMNCDAGRRIGSRGIRELKEGIRPHGAEIRNGGARHEEMDDGGLYYTDDEGRICFLPDQEEEPESPLKEASVPNGHQHHAEEGEGLSEQQWAVMAYTDAMTKDVKVPDAVFADLKQWFNDREIVEITTTVAAYNCVSRFLVALDVGEMNEATIDQHKSNW
ncbi:MAG: hypothetical protein Q9225_005109 [Loekoesia sp. 1 TL-2023]